jgi:hypothetical protein
VESCTSKGKLLCLGDCSLHVCEHPDISKNNPYGLIFCENLIKFGYCNEGATHE